MVPKSLRHLLALLLSGFVLLSLTGCRSTGEPGDASFAAVRIANRSADEISAAALRVFGEDGYAGGVTGPNRMVFEKGASRGTSYAREGVVAGFYGAQTFYRVKAQITPLAGGVFRLHCKTYAVTGGSDPFFQDEVPLSNMRSGSYQKLLDQIAKELE